MPFLFPDLNIIIHAEWLWEAGGCIKFYIMRRFFVTLATVFTCCIVALSQKIPIDQQCNSEKLPASSEMDEAESTIYILAIGNSFSEDAVEQNLYDLAKEAGFNVVIGNAFRGGYNLRLHWEAVKDGSNIYEYRKVVNGVRSNKSDQLLSDILADEAWDYVTFQQVSQEAGLYQTFEPYLSNLIDYAKTLCPNPNVRLAYHMPWAYAQNATHPGFVNYDNDQIKMYEAILSATQTTLAYHPELSFVIPSGTAIQNARTSFLGDNLNRDGFHLNLGIGRYIAACTWLEAILGVNPIGMNFRPSIIDGILASIGQKAAHAAIESPYAVTSFANEPYDGDNTIVPNDVLINFGDLPTSSDLWNNVTSQQTIITGLRDIKGNDTEITLMLNDAFNDTNTAGCALTSTSLNMPPEVSRSCFWGYSQGNFYDMVQQPTGEFTFTHMNKSLAYDFTFFASRADCSDNRETAFRLDGKDSRTDCLDATENSTNTITISGICPNSNGIITLTVSPGVHNDNIYKFYYINAVGIMAHEETGIIAPVQHEDNTLFYNLAGQRIAGSQMQKGIYIKDGKKVLVR